MLEGTLKVVEAYNKASTKHQSTLTVSKSCLKEYTKGRENDV